MKKIPLDEPIQLTNERAWRTYIGGKTISSLHEDMEVEDNHFPEEWIMSIVSARNAGREHIEEGLSKLYKYPDVSLKSLIETYPVELLGNVDSVEAQNSLGVLVKLIDAAERLTVQVHPDREKARQLFNSEFGKTECWHILDGREINGIKPSVYIGFKEGITRDKWIALFNEQNIEGMLECLYRFEVQGGETFIIRGGVPHAIGCGCFLAEIQEPTDYTIRIERTTPAGYHIDDFMCHQGVGFEKMFECFDFTGRTRQQALDEWCVPQHTLVKTSGGSIISILGYETTPFFKLNSIIVNTTLTIDSQKTFSGLYVLQGSGRIVCEAGTTEISKGNQFFLPAAMGTFKLQADPENELKCLHFFGKEASN